ncbi:MAG: ATP phosphoribosyltransferase regulatory subunit [Desulfuromonadaceae bacterium]|nr:ATP phosphoribosyltransferase regulatory subunit [Desulfuromonadaceae bacterium]MDD5105985.1 ATP phosphoribosyltransferase regulatory subunit [Desulfuromonadaceae bacterium]
MIHSPSDIALPRGVADFLPGTAAKIGSIENHLLRVFELWGFRRIITPRLEYEDVLSTGMGDELKGRTYRFDDRQSGRLLALPPDITPQIARIVATRMSALPLPHRISYSGRVLRQTEIQAGRSREIFQTGVELIGLDSPEADAEMIAMTIEALQVLGLDDFTVDLGQVEFCQGVFQASGLCGEPLQQLREAVSRKDSSAVCTLLKEHNVSPESARELSALPRLFGGREVLEAARGLVTNARSCAALDNLQEVLEILDIHGVTDYLSIDLGETRGLDYHSGITFEGFVSGFGEPVCSGGRYDNLIGRYGFNAPATGFTFNLLNLLRTIERQSESLEFSTTDFLLFNSCHDRRNALLAARQLRATGHTAARDIIRRDYDQSHEYAKKMNISYMLVISDDTDQYRVVRSRDGVVIPLEKDMLVQPGLITYIEESQGEDLIWQT